MRFTGKVKLYKDEQGYGFLTRDDGQGDVFFHIKQLRESGYEEPSPGDRFSFDVTTSDKGDRAVDFERL